MPISTCWLLDPEDRRFILERESLNGASWFTVMDCVEGFSQVAISEAAGEVFSFMTRDGVFRYCRLPQGAKISSTYDLLV